MRIKLAFILLTGTMIVSAQESEVLLKIIHYANVSITPLNIISLYDNLPMK